MRQVQFRLRPERRLRGRDAMPITSFIFIDRMPHRGMLGKRFNYAKYCDYSIKITKANRLVV